MKIGICRGMARYSGDVDAQYAHLKSLGFDTTDESLCETERPYYASREAMEEHCRPIREASEKYGIEVFQVHASYGVWYEKETWDETYAGILDILRLGLYGAHLMGAKNYVLHPLCESGFWFERTFFNAEETKERTLRCARDLLPDCEKYGICLCLENLPGKNADIFYPAVLAEEVGKIDSPYLGICLDTGHAAINGVEIGDAVRDCGKYLRCLHTHDNNGNEDQHNLPYNGTINWDSFTDALAEIGYEGSLSFEAGVVRSRYTPPHIREHLEKLCVMTARHLADETERKKAEK